MKSILNRLIEHEILNKKESKEILYNIADGKYNASQVSAFLTVYMMRSISVKELEGFRDALLELCLRINLEEFNPIDLCGTGGDNKDTFNISTLASFVTAGAGISVAKHGNYGVSSNCGSSNVMEYLGVKFSNNESFLKRCIDEAGICILHAPLFHPAMKNVAPARKMLGKRTAFNLLGPLCNPAKVSHQMIGVFADEYIERIVKIMQKNFSETILAVRSFDGMDELSTTSKNRACLLKDNQITEFIINPDDYKMQKGKLSDIQISTKKEAVNSFIGVLKNTANRTMKEINRMNGALRGANKPLFMEMVQKVAKPPYTVKKVHVNNSYN